ncbi:MAG: T9SS type A sorting domain-containing protein [Calditrichaeota bacterium]|nr:T9SS type A sorting domain-containing protein [Calditrichota bacterium]
MNLAKTIIIISLLFCVNSYGQTNYGNSVSVMNSAEDRIQQSDLVHFSDPFRTSQSMNILFKSFSGIDVVNGSEIACFTPDNVLAGATVLDPDDHEMGWGLAAWGDESMTPEVIEGFTNGEEIHLLFWDPVREWELEMSVEYRQGENLLYYTNNFIVVDATLDVKDNESTMQPHEFNLERIYPNPFNSTAIITYSVPLKSAINLSVFDLAGRKLKTLISGELTAGKHVAILNGSNLPNGIYLIVLESDDYRVVKRAVMIK